MAYRCRGHWSWMTAEAAKAPHQTAEVGTTCAANPTPSADLHKLRAAVSRRPLAELFQLVEQQAQLEGLDNHVPVG